MSTHGNHIRSVAPVGIVGVVVVGLFLSSVARLVRISLTRRKRMSKINKRMITSDVECARQWLVPSREVKPDDVQQCIIELNDILNRLKMGGYEI